MSLKNLIRVEWNRGTLPAWKLVTKAGQAVEAFTQFVEYLHAQNYSARTVKRYLEVVGRFLDYLYQAGVFGEPPLTTRHFNAIVMGYQTLIRDGSAATIERVRKAETSGTCEEAWMGEVAMALNLRPVQIASSTLAAIGHFLELSERLAREDAELAALNGIEPVAQIEGLVRAIQGHSAVSSYEVSRMRQNSLLGSVAKFDSRAIRRRRHLRLPRRRRGVSSEAKDFPFEFLDSLIEAATCWRDRALWLLLAASGIRTSEARNILLEDIDIENQTVVVIDPNERRFRIDIAAYPNLRNKGREMGATYLFPPLRQRFFEALKKYIDLEYVPMAGHSFLFQYVEETKRGTPFNQASDSAIVQSFHRAEKRAGVPLNSAGKQYGPHSLRHLYGVYMLNDYPLDPANNRFGLPITDVQMLMGHAQLQHTKRYARTKHTRLMEKLQRSDEELLGFSATELGQLPLGALGRLVNSND